MPEGPEVSWMIDQLQHLCGASLQDVVIISGRYVRHGNPINLSAFLEQLPLKINKICNKGKTIWIELSGGELRNIKIIPAMTGFLEETESPFTRIRFDITKGGSHYHLYFNDMRNFGQIYFLTDTQLDIELNKLGQFPLAHLIKGKCAKCQLSGSFNVNELLVMFRNKSGNRLIGDLLLEQDLIAGVGNYLRSEILYVAKIAPTRSLNSLSDTELKRIIKIADKLMRESYNYQKKHGFRSYPFKIYMRKDVATDQFKTKGRIIWWNSQVQK